jgi:signal transduction histidine kinase/CheY-like chemotaxis protein
MRQDSDASTRLLIFAPVGRDAELTRDLLARAAIDSIICPSVGEMVEQIAEGCAAVILTEEVFEQPDFGQLPVALRQQPPWSDIPVLLFAGSDGRSPSPKTIELLDLFPTVTLLDRPIRIAIAISIVRAAIRARERQLEVRDLLVALHASREEAEAASRLKDEFLATLSHELRTPLNAILGWISMLKHGQLDPARAARALEVIDRNARAQAQLVEDVLDMARIITGKLRVELQPVGLRSIVEAAVEALRPAADAKRIALILTVSTPDAEVRADADRLQQVFWNLLSNAVKFTPDGGTVTVRVDARNSHLRVSVTDTGIGLDPAFLPYVFDRFRQADQSVTRGHGGLGIGLAIVKHLVELHGGRVDVASEGRNRGSKFTVLLPVPAIIDRERDRATSTAAEAFAIRLPGRRVLVVDDDAATRELLSELFRGAEADVVTADSAAAALAAFERETPDVLIADIGLPGEDGLSLMRRIRSSLGGTRTVPSIALSAYTRLEDRDAAYAAGFTAFIGKPAAPQDLLSTVKRVLH